MHSAPLCLARAGQSACVRCVGARQYIVGTLGASGDGGTALGLVLSTAKASLNQLNNKRFKKAVRGVMLEHKMANHVVQAPPPKKKKKAPQPQPLAIGYSPLAPARPRAHTRCQCPIPRRALMAAPGVGAQEPAPEA
jgi:hypothetical protein